MFHEKYVSGTDFELRNEEMQIKVAVGNLESTSKPHSLPTASSP